MQLGVGQPRRPAKASGSVADERIGLGRGHVRALVSFDEHMEVKSPRLNVSIKDSRNRFTMTRMRRCGLLCGKDFAIKQAPGPLIWRIAEAGVPKLNGL